MPDQSSPPSSNSLTFSGGTGINCTGSYYQPSHYIYNTLPCACSKDTSIVIEKAEKGFILQHNDKEYACESLHSAYEVLKKLFKNSDDK